MVNQDENNKGIYLSKEGIKEAILFNKIKGIRAAVIPHKWLAEMARAHNRLNMMVVALDNVAKYIALDNIEAYLKVCVLWRMIWTGVIRDLWID